jgi:hypothetical protein
MLQVRKLTGLGQKKAHLIEIQVNGGTTNDKVDFATKLFEKVSRLFVCWGAYVWWWLRQGRCNVRSIIAQHGVWERLRRHLVLTVV